MKPLRQGPRPRGTKRGAGGSADTTLKEEHRDERVDRERLGEAEADDHRHLELGKDLRLAPHRLHGALAEETDADARPDGREADAERESESQRCGEKHGFTSLRLKNVVT